MKFCIPYLFLFFAMAFGPLSAHPGHDDDDQFSFLHDDHSEEPQKLYVPKDQTDIFAIPLDSDELEQEEELENLEKQQKQK